MANLAAIKKAAEEAAHVALAERSKSERNRETDENLDTLSRKDFANEIYSRVVEALQGHVTKSLEAVTTAFEGRFIALDKLIADKTVGEAEKLPYFNEFRDKVAERLKTRPELTPTEAFHLVKAENPDEVKRLTDAEEAKTREAAEAAKPKFGGLLPTSNSISVNTQDMTPKQAADAAFSEAFKNIPPTLYNGEPAN